MHRLVHAAAQFYEFDCRVDEVGPIKIVCGCFGLRMPGHLMGRIPMQVLLDLCWAGIFWLGLGVVDVAVVVAVTIEGVRRSADDDHKLARMSGHELTAT